MRGHHGQLARRHVRAGLERVGIGAQQAKRRGLCRNLAAEPVLQPRDHAEQRAARQTQADEAIGRERFLETGFAAADHHGVAGGEEGFAPAGRKAGGARLRDADQQIIGVDHVRPPSVPHGRRAPVHEAEAGQGAGDGLGLKAVVHQRLDLEPEQRAPDELAPGCDALARREHVGREALGTAQDLSHGRFPCRHYPALRGLASMANWLRRYRRRYRAYRASLRFPPWSAAPIVGFLIFFCRDPYLPPPIPDRQTP